MEIEDGEFVVLVGPSGCGKSTLLNLVSGLETLSDGNVHIGERKVNDIAPKDRDIAMVFQSYALYPTKSVEGQHHLRHGHPAGYQGGAPEGAERTSPTSCISRCCSDRKPGQLSGGQRQRVAMGRRARA